MGKMNELNILLQDFHAAAQALVEAYNNLHDFFGRYTESQAQTDEPKPAPTEPKPAPLTLEQVRGVLADKSRAGFTAEIRTLLEKHGAAKLSEIDPSKYTALLAEAEGLGNG